MKKEIIVDVTIGIMLTLYLIIGGTIIAVSKNKEVIQYYSYNAENIKNSYIENTESEYYINNAQDLWEFANKVNNGNTFEGITVYLTTDINLECNQNKQWIPIGACYVEGGNNADDTTEKDPFAGTFEGNDYSISGLYIDSESNYVGLFGYNQGTIQNLKLKDSYIKSNKPYIGGIAGFNKGIIQNCHNYANIVTELSGGGACGGIAGYSTSASIVNCSNKGKIEGENGCVGGIIGFGFFTDVNNCYNEGIINVIGYSVGGIVGSCQSSWLLNCYNQGEIKGYSEIGGIVGFIYKFSSITNCYNMGIISISSNSSNEEICIGGIIGRLSLALIDSYKVQNCYSAGKIELDVSNEETPTHAGNIVGEYIGGSVENCYYEKNGIEAIGKNKEDSTVNITELDSMEMKSQKIVELLNGEESIYCLDKININNGYPILEWQYVSFLRTNSNVVIDEESLIIKGIEPKMTGEVIKKILKIETDIEIQDKNGNIESEKCIICTGYKIKVEDNKTYILVVTGDCTGDGKSDIQDIFAINKHRLNNGKLVDEYLLAGDANRDGKTNINDIFQINKYRLGIITEL